MINFPIRSLHYISKKSINSVDSLTLYLSPNITLGSVGGAHSQ